MSEYMVLEGTIKMRPVDNGNGNGNGNGGNGGGSVIKGDFEPVWKLQSAETQPSGGIRVGRYSISDGLIVVSYLLAFSQGMNPGVPKPTGTSRYYFELPPEIPDISGNVAEHGSVRMFDGREELSGVPTLYGAIDRAVIAEVNGQKWGVNTPFSLIGNTRYISVGIFWIP